MVLKRAHLIVIGAVFSGVQTAPAQTSVARIPENISVPATAAPATAAAAVTPRLNGGGWLGYEIESLDVKISQYASGSQSAFPDDPLRKQPLDRRKGGYDLVVSGTFYANPESDWRVMAPLGTIIRGSVLQRIPNLASATDPSDNRGGVAVLKDGTIVVARAKGRQEAEVKAQFGQPGNGVVQFMGGGALIIENGKRVESDRLKDDQKFSGGIGAAQFRDTSHVVIATYKNRAFVLIALDMTGGKMQADLLDFQIGSERVGFDAAVMFDGGGGCYARSADGNNDALTEYCSGWNPTGFGVYTRPPDLAAVLVIDGSGSMSGRKIVDAKRAALESLDPYHGPDPAIANAEFGVLEYSGGCGTNFWFHPFVPEYDPLERAVNALTTGGSTPMTPALYQARHAIWNESRARRGTIILMTDGENDCSDSPVEAADRIYRRIDSSVPTGRTLVPGLGPVGGLLALVSPMPLWAANAQQGAPKYPGFHQIDMSSAVVSPERRNIPITVSTIGFQVSDRQQVALDSIAAAGRGVSVRAENAAQLASAFQTAVRAAAAPPPTPSAAPAPAPAGGGPVVGRRSGPSPYMILLLGLSALAILLLGTFVAVSRGGLRVSIPAFTPVKGPRGAVQKIELTLEVDAGSERPSVQTFGIAPVTIGRDSSNRLVLTDPEVSRWHARIDAEAGRLEIVDLGSTAGILVGGRTVERAELLHGTEIRLGSTRILVR